MTDTDNILSPRDAWLSPHFRLADLTVSGASVRHRIDNTPPPETVGRLVLLCRDVLEPLRRRFGVIRVTSAYRCAALNRIAGGTDTSPYLTGDAADLHVSCREQGERFIDFIARNALPAEASLYHRERSAVWRVQVRRKERTAHKDENVNADGAMT